MAFEKYILPDNDEPKMAVHALRAIVDEYIQGEKTKLECLAAIEGYLDVTLDTNEKSDLQAWMVAIDAASTDEEKRSVADETYRVMVLAGHGIWYTTKALLKARLSWI